MEVIAIIAPVLSIAVILIVIIMMIVRVKNFKDTIKKTIEVKKTIEETITARAKQQLEEALKENENPTCEYCGTAYNKGDKKCSSCGSTLKNKK